MSGPTVATVEAPGPDPLVVDLGGPRAAALRRALAADTVAALEAEGLSVVPVSAGAPLPAEARAVVVGDPVGLNAASVAGAIERGTVALGPTAKGGYWLAAGPSLGSLLDGAPIGTEASRRLLLERAPRVELVEPLRGLDSTEDLIWAVPRMRRGGLARGLVAALLAEDGALPLPLPRRLHLEITNRCNSLCETCVRTMDPDPDRDLSPEELTALLEPLTALESVALQVNGEPLLYPHLGELIARLGQRGVRVELNTNALNLHGERARALLSSGLDQLNVSVDGARPETYARIRGVDGLSKLVDNVRAFVALRAERARPRIEVWTTVSQQNVDELPEIVDLAARMGVDGLYLQRLVHFSYGLARLGDSLHGRTTPEQERRIAEALARARTHGLEVAASGGHRPADMLRATDDPEPFRDCRRPWESAVVMANGDVVPCCISTFVAPRPSITMGNVIDEPWSAVWNGERYRRFRAGLSSGRAPDACRRCGVCWSL